MKEFAGELKKLKKKKLLRKPVCLESSRGSKISINGQTWINFSSNDYLNLSGHIDIVKTAVTALKKYGFGSGASRLLSGAYTPHKRLEERIAQFKKTRAALVFNTGYAANTGIIPAIAGADAVIFSDELNHASIVDGVRLSKAEVKIYRHKDMDHLEVLLKRSYGQIGTKSPHTPLWKRGGIKKSPFIKGGYRGIFGGKGGLKIIITDTVFSMDGDIAPLKDIVSLSKKYDALLMVDDAHGTGVLGKTGRGGLEHFSVNAGNIIQMGTLSKAFGCFGAFAAGSGDLIDLLINRARSFIYSTSLPPAMAEACIKAVDIVDSGSHDLRKKLWGNRQRLYQGLKNLGYDTLGSETPIIPVMMGNINNTLRVGRHLYKHKIYAPAIRPPTVPAGKCRIRFSVTAAHTKKDIDTALECLRKCS